MSPMKPEQGNHEYGNFFCFTFATRGAFQLNRGLAPWLILNFSNNSHIFMISRRLHQFSASINAPVMKFRHVI